MNTAKISTARSSVQTFLFNIAGLAAKIALGILVARILGPTNKGILTLIILYPSLFFVLGHFNLGLSTIHHLGKRKHKKGEFVGSLNFFSLVISVGLLVIFFISYFLLTGYVFKNVPVLLLFLGISILPFNLFIYYFSSFFQGLGRIKWYNILNNLPKFIAPVLVVGFCLLWRFTVLEGVLVSLFGVIVASFLVWRLIKKAVPGKWQLNKQLIKKLFSDGAKLQVGTIAAFLVSRADQFIIGNSLPLAELGYYSVAVVITELIFFLSIAVETVLYPKTSHQTLGEAKETAARASRIVLWLSILAGIGLAIFSKIIILLYGGQAFLPAVTPLLILIPGTVFFVIPKLLSTFWIRKGWFLKLSYIASSMAIFNIILNLILVPKYGITGAALASSLTYFLTFLVVVTLYYFFADKKLYKLFIPTKDDILIFKNLYHQLLKHESHK